jgi:hypothetical protein
MYCNYFVYIKYLLVYLFYFVFISVREADKMMQSTDEDIERRAAELQQLENKVRYYIHILIDKTLCRAGSFLNRFVSGSHAVAECESMT